MYNLDNIIYLRKIFILLFIFKAFVIFLHVSLIAATPASVL